MPNDNNPINDLGKKRLSNLIEEAEKSSVQIVLTNYTGAITLEPMNWDYENLSIQEFLELAYSKAKQLEKFRKNQ